LLPAVRLKPERVSSRSRNPALSWRKLRDRALLLVRRAHGGTRRITCEVPSRPS
jgi:hypothetical protein